MGDFSCSRTGVSGELATLSNLGSSTGVGRGAGGSLGDDEAEEMVAGGSSSSSSSEDSDDEDSDEEEELDEVLLSESDKLSFSPSESAYGEHLEDESLSSSSPGNPEKAIKEIQFLCQTGHKCFRVHTKC